MTGVRRPDFFIIGAPKAGTTSLYDWLGGHPQLYLSAVKEPMYFCPDVQGGLRRLFAYPEDEARYLALFEKARPDQLAGEASTRYLVSPEAPRFVRDFQPEARAIAVLRNPVDLMHALHNERVSFGVEPLTDFDAALAADADRRAGKRLPPHANPLGSVYRATASFAAQLERWLEALGRERVHVAIFEDMVGQPGAVFGRVLDFLDVDPVYQPATFAASNPSHRLRGGAVRAALDSRTAQWTAHSALPALLGTERTQRLARRFRLSRVNRRRAARQPLAIETRKRLESELTPDVEHLSELLGRDMVGLWFGSDAPVDGASPVSSRLASPSNPEPA